MSTGRGRRSERRPSTQTKTARDVVEGMLGGRRETKPRTGYIMELDDASWPERSIALLREQGSSLYKDPWQDVIASDPELDPRLKNPRRTCMFEPHMDRAWLDEMHSVLRTCAFGDPFPDVHVSDLFAETKVPSKRKRT